MWSNPYTRTQNSMSVGVGQNGFNSFTPFSLFSSGEDGFLYDFSKTDRLFQDTAGTTAVASDADPIGLALEGHAWGGKTLAQMIAGQAELSPNVGPYSNTANWTGVNSASLAAVGGEIEITAGAGFSSAYIIVPVIAGRAYEVSAKGRRGTATAAFMSVQRNSSGANIVDGFGNANLAIGSTTTTVKSRFTAPSGETAVRVLVVHNNQAVGSTLYASSVSVKAIPGNHGSQASNPARPFWKTPNFARLDGADDNLLTSLLPGPVMSLFSRLTVPASPTTTHIIAGSNISSDRMFYGFTVTGRLVAGVGGQNSTTITGTNDLRGKTLMLGLIFDGTTVRLFEDDVAVYSAAQSGVIGTTSPIRIGAGNQGGTASNFLLADMPKTLAVNRVLAAWEITNLKNYWNAQ